MARRVPSITPAMALATVVLGLLLAACTGRVPTPSLAVPFPELLEDPDSYAALQVRVDAAYLRDREVSVAAARLAGDPPRPEEPTVWVDAPIPEGPCVESAGDAVWIEEAEVSGLFEYSPAGGLGRDGEWTMALDEATVLCPGEDLFDSET